MKTICVFCGSSRGARPEYLQAAIDLGICLVQRNIRLVYGGARIGVMGRIATTMLEHGGQVIGVMPQGLVDKEVAHQALTELHITASMHERKAMMADLADGFIALPGGFGTLEEVLEILTWAQLGLHRKPCGILNVCGYFDGLLGFLDHSVSEKFIEADHRSMLLLDTSPEALLAQFSRYQPPVLDKVKHILENQLQVPGRSPERV